MTVAELATPAALVDVDVLEGNLSRLADAAAAAEIAVRPHVKTHKSPEIAARQLALGAVGVTTATLGEAVAMADAGVEDVFVYYPLVDARSADALVELGERVRVSTTVEDERGVQLLGAAAARLGVELEVLADVDTGLGRTGVALGAELERLCVTVERSPHLRLAGIATHEGFAYSMDDPAMRTRVVAERLGAFAEAGRTLGVERISCGCTPSLYDSLGVDGITEVRPGNYALLDAMQVGLGSASLDECALTVLTTVVSVRGPDRAIADAGSKALSSDRGVHGDASLKGHGLVRGRPEITVEGLSEEHGWLGIEPGHAAPSVGERLEVVPNHACATVACFDTLHLVSGGAVTERSAVARRRLEAA